jgi:hypothetical protein
LLSQADFAGMITRCRSCPGAQGCLAFLSEHPERVDAAPDWCGNAAILSRARAAAH